MIDLNYNGVDFSNESYFEDVHLYNNEIEEILFNDEYGLVSFTLPFIINRNLEEILFIYLNEYIKDLSKKEKKEALKNIKSWFKNDSHHISFLTIPENVYNKIVSTREEL